MTDVAVTEFTEIDPDELHLVGKGANGFRALLAKSASEEVREVLEDIATAIDADVIKAEDREKCDVCGGIAKSDEPCKKCFGTGLLPHLGETPAELMAAAKATAPSGAPVKPADKCPTCCGTGYLPDDKPCPDCDMSGKDSTEPPSDKLARVDGDGQKIHEGDSKNREAVDKSVIELCDDDECDVCKELDGEELEKAKLKAKARNALPDSAFALPGRRYPIHDESHARNALSRVAQNGTPEEKATVRAAVKRKYPNIDVGGDDATKADGTVLSGPNPNLATSVATATDASSGSDDNDASSPGSAAWEAVDAATATSAAVALMAAAELMRTFAQREGQEVAAGEGSDIIDVYDASQAICLINEALGIAARMAFHEGLEAAKGSNDEEVVEKSGKRLSRKSVSSLAELRDHITTLLGDDDPTKTTDKDDATIKSVEIDMDALSKEIENMETDELTKVLDARDEKLVGIVSTAFAEALKGKSATETAEGIAGGKSANAKAKNKKPKAENTDLEDEADQGTQSTANNSPSGAAKSEGDETVTDDDEVVEPEAVKAEAELTDEEIEAKQAKKAAKKALKEAEQVEKDAAENAATRRAIEEATAEVRKSNAVLEERLAAVEKMAAPSTIVRTRPADALNKAAEKDELELRIAGLERSARETADADIRKASREEAKELRVQLASL